MKVAALVPNHNGSDSVLAVVGALLAQSIPQPHHFEVIIVDDGSTDDSVQMLEAQYGNSVQLVRLGENKGRSFARNSAAWSTRDDIDLLVFVDSDCIPTDKRFISAHIARIEAGADLVFGDVTAEGNDFWSKLQQDVAAARRTRYAAGDQWVFTTANFSVRRSLMFDHGGFDPSFDRYGFEDRDFFARVASPGARVEHASDATVIHMDRLTLKGVAKKQCEAGRHGARRFHDRHPGVYGRMALSRLDCGLHPWLIPVDTFTAPIAHGFCTIPDAWLEWRWLPFRLRSIGARAIYGLSYMHGTRLALSDAGIDRDR
ncbi:MAG TPA: glycosyltransferase family A protein [Lysobacter sp.]